MLIAGRPGNSTSDIERLVQDLGIAASARLLGLRSDVPALMQAADVFVFPSLFEGLGVSLLQAMGSGLPCVTTDAPPMSEVVTHDRTGLLVPPRDPDAIAAAIVRLAGDAALRESLGARARQHIADNFSADKAARDMEALYLRLLEPEGRRPSRFWLW